MRSDCPCPGMDRMRCIEAGMDDYISKHMRMTKLHAALVRHYPDRWNMIKNIDIIQMT